MPDRTWRTDRSGRASAAPRRVVVARPPTELPADASAPPPTVRRASTVSRVVVTSPQTEAARQATPATRRLDELADQTEIGDVLIRSLMRAQLGLGLRVLAVLVVLLGGLPLLFAAVPSAGRMEVGGVAVAWLLLGVATFPLLVLLGVLYMRQAERNEREFTDLVER